MGSVERYWFEHPSLDPANWDGDDDREDQCPGCGTFDDDRHVRGCRWDGVTRQLREGPPDVG